MYLDIARSFTGHEHTIEKIQHLVYFVRYLNQLENMGNPSPSDFYGRPFVSEALGYLQRDETLNFMHSYHWVVYDRDNDVCLKMDYNLPVFELAYADNQPFTFNKCGEFNTGHNFEVFKASRPIRIDKSNFLLGFVIGDSYKYDDDVRYFVKVHSFFA